MIPTNQELLEVQVKALFTQDAAGRLLHINEPNGSVAPRVFFGQTLQRNLWRFRADATAEWMQSVEPLLVGEPTSVDLHVPPKCFGPVREVLASFAPIHQEDGGPAYWFTSLPNTPAGVIPITEDNQDLLCAYFAYLLPTLMSRQPCMAVVRDGSAVSVCFSARWSPRAAEAGLQTAPEFRRHGYAAAVTAAWAAAVGARGRLALYSTSWDNLASQGVARHLGLLLYGTDYHFS